jgi:hypothetical protein
MDKPGHFSGDSRWFYELNLQQFGAICLIHPFSSYSRRLQHALEWLVQLTHLILAERACPEPTFSLFRAALAKEYLVLIFNY